MRTGCPPAQRHTTSRPRHRRRPWEEHPPRLAVESVPPAPKRSSIVVVPAIAESAAGDARLGLGRAVETGPGTDRGSDPDHRSHQSCPLHPRHNAHARSRIRAHRTHLPPVVRPLPRLAAHPAAAPHTLRLHTLASPTSLIDNARRLLLNPMHRLHRGVVSDTLLHHSVIVSPREDY